MSEHRTQFNPSAAPSILRMELVEKRTAHRKVFENQDYSRTVEIYMQPVHCQMKDGDYPRLTAKHRCII